MHISFKYLYNYISSNECISCSYINTHLFTVMQNGCIDPKMGTPYEGLSIIHCILVSLFSCETRHKSPNLLIPPILNSDNTKIQRFIQYTIEKYWIYTKMLNPLGSCSNPKEIHNWWKKHSWREELYGKRKPGPQAKHLNAVPFFSCFFFTAHWLCATCLQNVKLFSPHMQ